MNCVGCSDTITLEDVGLRDYNFEDDDRGHGFFGSSLVKGSGRLPRWARPIKYLHIYSCDAFSVSSLLNLGSTIRLPELC